VSNTSSATRTSKARARRQAALAAALESRVGFVRISEAAALFGVTRQTVWSWHRRGILPQPITIGGAASASVSGFPAAVIADLLAGRSASPGASAAA